MRLILDNRYGILACKHGRTTVDECTLGAITAGVARWAITGGYYDSCAADLQNLSQAELRRLVMCIADSIHAQLRNNLPEDNALWIDQELSRVRRTVSQHRIIVEQVRDKNVLFDVVE
ncbi:MAG: hypothetical protein KatS3mg038_3725 [Candidatus Kapaibacterium sp.]|nr:MAG: hypothetical protein KatS3mg038_2327 [Candidatus Kapabacteria bacterium]GIV53204.1 MAG: hypothetical protein KatS3mg038_3725 [Candidatus Kapabacteria bacterium]